tara:strand:+ start:899 stop:1579 length:681 start_codon:yes stop_codon:yes gene_type:complete
LSWLSIEKPLSKKNLNNVKIYESLIKFFLSKNIKNFIYFGSIKEYGNLSGKISENTNPKPNTWYGKSKLKVGIKGQELAKKYNANFLHLRISNILGISTNKNKIINKIFINKFFNKNANFNFYRNFIYVNDLLNVIQFYIKYPYNGVINVGGHDTIKFNYFLDKYCSHLRIPIIITRKKKKFIFENYKSFSYSIKKLSKSCLAFQSTPLRICYKKMIKEQIKLFSK